MDDEREMRAVLRAVARLPRREQDVLALCTWAGLTYEEAALALDLPVGTVRSRLSRARTGVRERLESKGDARNDGQRIPAEEGLSQ
jgi:RNA polymerase sigma-70 factor (ECF subfamily)